MAEQKTFSVTMSYLRDVIAKQTFHDSPAAALRELVQNAHDACMVQSALTGTTDFSVHITLNPVEKTITIADNGVGMSEFDIHEYLTTIGRGRKGESIAEKYGPAARNRGRLDEVIGEFGFGFIAAFIIADRIELWTRGAEDGTQPMHCEFSCEGESYLSEEAAKTVEVGTKLVLHLNRDTLSRGLKPTDNPIDGNILSHDTVEAIIRKYCILLEFPIFVYMDGDVPGARGNQIEDPWKNQKRLSELVQFFYENRIGKGNLGQILKAFRISLSRDKGDPVTLDAVLLIEDAPLTDEQPGNLEVFVKRMWVCEREQSLLPAWASFLRGVISTPELHPLPGRDVLDRGHEGFDRVKKALHSTIHDAFLSLARENPATFNETMNRYGRQFRFGLAKEQHEAENERRQFSDAELVRYVRFVRYGKKYVHGNICNLNEYLNVRPTETLDSKDKKRVVYIVPRAIPQDRQLEFRRLLASRPTDVIVPSDGTELALLLSIDDIFPNIVVRGIESELLKGYAGLLEGDQRTSWKLFIDYYKALSSIHHVARADVGDMAPEHMPAVILSVPGDSDGTEDVEDPAVNASDADLQRRMQDEEKRRIIKSTLVPGMPSGVAEQYDQILVINSRNPTMKHLLDYKVKAEIQQIEAGSVLDECLHECYHMALNAALGSVGLDTLQHNVETACQLIQNYLTTQLELVNAERSDRSFRDELATLQDDLKNAKSDLERYETTYGKLETEAAAVPTDPEERMGVVVFCDMVASTSSLVAMDFAQRGDVLNEFVEIAKDEVQDKSGFFDKFTGDGLVAFFGIENERPREQDFSLDAWDQACGQAWQFVTAIEAAMVRYNAQEKVRRIISDNNLDAIMLRMAIDTGPVLFGRFGGTGTSVGVPVIVAARLCAEKKAFAVAERSILVTEGFQSKHQGATFEEVEYKFVPAGVNRKIRIYRLRRG